MVFRFQTKLTLFFAALLLVIQACSMAAVYWYMTSTLKQQSQDNLIRLERLFQTKLSDISSIAQSQTNMFIHDSDFKQQLITNNRENLFSALFQLGQQIHANRILLINHHKSIVIDTELSENLQNQSVPVLLNEVQDKPSSVNAILNRQLYHWHITPLSIEKKQYWLLSGFELEPLLKKYLTSFSAIPTTVLVAYQTQHTPWAFLDENTKPKDTLSHKLLEMLNNASQLKQAMTSPLDIQEYTIFVLPLTKQDNDQSILAIMLYSREDLFSMHEGLTYGLMVASFFGILLLLLGSILIARNLTKPLEYMKNAIKRIKNGDYSQAIINHRDDELGQIVTIFNDMMQTLQNRENTLLLQNRHDPVTNLPNRIYLFEYFTQLLKNYDPAQNSIAVVTIGIDRFPQINHALGHHIGDRLLHHVAERLTKSLTQAQFIARLASNVFVALIPNVHSGNYTEIAEYILDLFETPFSVYTVHIDLEVLLGFSFFASDGIEADILIQKADVALYSARFASERYSLYRAEKDPHHFNKLSLMSELREGLNQNEFEVYYQPKVNLLKNKVVQVESLIRWHHPAKGLIPPFQFIPLAEETGHIKKLTLWLIEKAMSQCALWYQQKLPIGVSINLSVKDLLNKRLPDYVANMIQTHQVDPDWITFEITESAFMHDPENAMQAILHLKELGVNFSIDDFGTGFSSLKYLRQLPINELKIDQSFIQELSRSKRAAQIVRSTIALGHSLDIEVVAEGVSDQESFELLKGFECDLGQGYFFSQALPLNDFMQWLASSTWGIR